MKFGKLLSRAEELLPDLKRLCLRYKQLKKQLRQLHSNDGLESEKRSSSAKRELSKQEQDFINMLNEDMKRFNDYFCDKEEEVVIWLQQLDEQLAAAKTLRDKQLCHIGYIHLHGQLVLLYHWSMLNYAALVKILKKHDKTTGLLLKAPFLSNALKQPFSTTGMLSSLMSKCEAKASELNSVTGGLESLLESCPQYEGLFLMKETQAALELWKELRSNVSTPSTFVDPTAELEKVSERGSRRKRRKASSSDGENEGAGTAGEGASCDAASHPAKTRAQSHGVAGADAPATAADAGPTGQPAPSSTEGRGATAAPTPPLANTAGAE